MCSWRFCAITYRQVGDWINSYALFKYASGVTDEDYFGYDKDGKVDLEKASLVKNMVAKTHDNYFAFNHIGIAYDKDGKELWTSDSKASQEKFDRSAAAFAATLAIKPDYDFGNNNLGVYFARQGKAHDAQTAEKYFRQAIAVNQRYADAYNNLGIVLAEQGDELSRQGRYAEALGKFEDAARQHQSGIAVRYDRASDRNNLCRVYLKMGRVHKAAAEKARADRDSAKAEQESELQDAALNAAMKENNTALECDRNFIGAVDSRIEILSEQNKLKDIVPCYERIIEIDPTHEGIQALNWLVAYYGKDSDKVQECLENAGEKFRRAIAVRPPSIEFVQMPLTLADKYATLNQSDKAARWLDQMGECFNQATQGKLKAEEILPERLRLAIFCLKIKQPDKALFWLNQVFAANGSWVEAYAVAHSAYEMQGKTREAQADFDRVLRATLQERFKAALDYLEMQQPDKTIALMNQILASNGQLLDVYYVRGCAYEMKGDLQAAQADLEHVVKLAPTIPGAQEKLKAGAEEKLKAVNAELAKRSKKAS